MTPDESKVVSSPDRMAEKLVRVAEYALIVVFGLLPVFFIPGTSAPLVYTKVAVVLAAVLAATVLGSFSLLRSGSVRFRTPPSLLAFVFFCLVAFVSALLSGSLHDALIGGILEIHTVAFLALLAATMFAWMCIGGRRRVVMHTYTLLFISASLLALFHLARIVMGDGFLSFGVFSGNVTFSPIGAWNNLAIFFGLTIIVSLIALEQLVLSALARVLLLGVVGLSLALLAVVNFFNVWIILGVVSLVVLVYGLARDRLTAHRHEILSRPLSKSSLSAAFVTFVMSVVFVIGGTAVGGFISGITDVSYIEVRPSIQATTGIVRDVYRENPLIGVGPNQFVDAWRLYRQPEINTTIFWATDFSSGFGYVPTFFATTGVIGGVAITAFVLLFLYSGIRYLMYAAMTDRAWYFIGISSFASALYLWSISFIYVPGAVMLLLAAMCTGIFYAAYNAAFPDRNRVFTLGTSPRTNFMLVAGAVVTVGASIFVAYGVSQHYAAAHYYNKGVGIFQQSGDVVAAEELTARAYTYVQDDLFARRIAEYESIRLAEVLSSTSGNQGELQARFQEIFNNGTTAARTATELDSNDADNWSVLGGFYASVVRFNIDGVYEEAKQALVRAQELDPQNPSRVLALAQLELFNNNIEAARATAREALRLKPNYSDAIYLIAQLDIIAGDIPRAVDAAESIVLIEPNNPVRFFQLGVLRLADSDPAAAAQSLERAIMLNNQYANARYFLAFAYDALGRPEDARTELAAVLSLNPGNQQVQDLLGRLNRGESLALSPEDSSATSSSELNPPVAEPTETSPQQDEPVTTGEAPDSPLLSPANVGTENSSNE